MYRHLLIPFDGSPFSAKAVDQGLAFAKDAGARVTILTVIEPFNIFAPDADQIGNLFEEYTRQMEEKAAARLAQVAEKAAAAAVPCDTVKITSGLPYKAIIETAEKAGCDLIAMASHGRRGLEAMLLGSETTKVLTHSTVPVLVFR